jgi:uncharacterized protein (DUF433 family)
MSIESIITEHIEVTPDINGSKPRIIGHRVRVQDVVIWHEEIGLSPHEIVARYPSITLADVYAALAYYHDHRGVIDRQIAADDALEAQLKAQIPSKLAQAE